MPMVGMESDEPRDKRPIEILRERHGGVHQELLERTRKHTKVRKQITQALRDAPKTIPEIAAATGVPAHEVTWQVMAMKKYGKVVEGEERDSYFAYALTGEQESKK
jgi:predicted Rossmann fold nucleotide-binding protein DprA/Smf involved in DNA uptake